MNNLKHLPLALVSIFLATALPLTANSQVMGQNPLKGDLKKPALTQGKIKLDLYKVAEISIKDKKSIQLQPVDSKIKKHSETGGIDGGGGELNFDDLEYASVNEIAETVKIARVPIEAIFRNIEIHLALIGNFPSDSRPSGYDELEKMYSRFFKADKNVFAVLSKLVFDVQNSAPCKDPHTGQNRDASVTHGNSDRICISAFTLSRKLIKKPEDPESYKARIIALIFHELAHIFNANETESIEIQKNVFSAYRNKDILTRYTGYRGSFVFSIPDLSSRSDGSEMLEPWIAAIQNQDTKFFIGQHLVGNFDVKAYHILKYLEHLIPSVQRRSFTRLYNADRAFLNLKEFQTLEQMYLRMRIIGDFLIEHKGEKDWFYNVFEKLGSNLVSIDQWYQARYTIHSPEFSDSESWRHPDVTVMIKKYQTREDTVADIQETIDTLKVYGAKINERAKARFTVKVTE